MRGLPAIAPTIRANRHNRMHSSALLLFTALCLANPIDFVTDIPHHSIPSHIKVKFFMLRAICFYASLCCLGTDAGDFRKSIFQNNNFLFPVPHNKISSVMLLVRNSLRDYPYLFARARRYLAISSKFDNLIKYQLYVVNRRRFRCSQPEKHLLFSHI